MVHVTQLLFRIYGVQLNTSTQHSVLWWRTGGLFLLRCRHFNLQSSLTTLCIVDLKSWEVNLLAWTYICSEWANSTFGFGTGVACWVYSFPVGMSPSYNSRWLRLEMVSIVTMKESAGLQFFQRFWSSGYGFVIGVGSCRYSLTYGYISLFYPLESKCSFMSNLSLTHSFYWLTSSLEPSITSTKITV